MIKHLILTALALGLLTTPLLAHSPMTESAPDNGAVLAEPPSEITLNFAGPIRMMKATLDEVGKGGTKEIALDIPDKKPNTTVVIPVKVLSGHEYTLSWRGMSGDGHVMKGEVSFSVSE
ncbi:MAG: copper resistance CopC family protein [Pseudomonadota bacterium]